MKVFAVTPNGSYSGGVVLISARDNGIAKILFAHSMYWHEDYDDWGDRWNEPYEVEGLDYDGEEKIILANYHFE